MLFFIRKKERKMHFHQLSEGNNDSKISLSQLNPLLKRIGKSAIIILPALLFSNLAFAEEIPKTAAKSAKAVKTAKKAAEAAKAAKAAKRSTEILQQASGLFTLEEICRKGIDRAAKNPKPTSYWGLISPTSALLITCGVLGLHMYQVLVEEN
jgi:hypothetical protein